MGKIPSDATHWDSGDWIDWHRRSETMDAAPCISPAQDESARMTALHVSLLRAARAHYVLTGDHLPVYDAIAQVHAALHFCLPLKPSAAEAASVQMLVIAPNGPTNRIKVDLAHPCSHVLVTRISDNFAVEARMLARDALPAAKTGKAEICWSDLPETP